MTATDERLDPRAVQPRLAGLMRLVEITRDLAARHDLDEVLETVTTSVCEALDCERASLYLYDEQRNELYTRVVTELEIEEIRAPADSGITGWCARRRKIANIPDPHVDARWNSSVDKRTGFHTCNILAAPLISPHDDRLVGVLQLLNKRGGCFNEFDEQLVEAFASHAATALERAELLEEIRRSQRLQAAIEVGQSIQRSFLPDRLPEIPGYEVAVWWQPAETVSGDYYDIIPLPDGRLGLIVADVSGHGVGPSLIMASARAMIRVISRTCSDPQRILAALAETISPDLHDGRFITFLIAALDPRTHELTFANAGHGPALLFRRASGEFQPLETTSLPLGFPMKAETRPGGPLAMAPGDILLLATDGSIELRNGDDAMFGRKRLERLVRENRRLPATKLLEVLRQAIGEFHPNPHPPDDITLMIVERKKGAGLPHF